MDRIATAQADERADVFRQAASAVRPARSPEVIEKDFWVCWILRQLFEAMHFRPQLIFKGGTSLSKAYHVIDRFSEDVDLSLSRADLGFGGPRAPEQAGIIKAESKRRLAALVTECQHVIGSRLLPELKARVTATLGRSGWHLALDAADPQTVVFTYPGSGLAYGVQTYIRPAIRLEFGARADNWPAEECLIRPYAADVFPTAFTVAPTCHVRTLDVVRTFWEKATLLHAEHHRPSGKPAPDRLSRHYYDLHQLSRSPIGDKALADSGMLGSVVRHKRLFFASAWAHYELAVPGTLHLLPTSEQERALRTDYARMQAMIFGQPPKWEDIMTELTALERRIHLLGSPP